MSVSAPLVDVQDLTIDYRSEAGVFRAVDHVSLQIFPGQAYGLIGESGSGKSSLAYALLCYSQAEQIGAKCLNVAGVDLLVPEKKQLLDIRGARIGMVYQDPISALNPLMRVGSQITEVLVLHSRMGRASAKTQMLKLLEQVRFDDPEIIARRFPHQLSGGQQQRIVIAMAVACRPQLLILDEPTTGLDVTTEASILQLINELRHTINCSVLLISHNLAVVGKVCSRIGVMQAGVMVEENCAHQILTAPVHPYTKVLLEAARALNGEILPRKNTAATEPLLEASTIRHCFQKSNWLSRLVSKATIPVIDGISFNVKTGTTLAIVGESGSGKSTLARCIAGLISMDSGSLHLNGKMLPGELSQRSLQQKRDIQIILQNPEAALNPSQTVFEIISRPLQLYGLFKGSAVRARVIDLLKSVNLDESHLFRYPRQLSGGQKQRIAIARAFAAQPQVIICDEPTSALDISVQAALLDNLRKLQEEHKTTYILISHDLGVIRQMADEVIVMRNGVIVERGHTKRIFSNPQHAYTRELIDARLALPNSEQAPSDTAEMSTAHATQE